MDQRIQSVTESVLAIEAYGGEGAAALLVLRDNVDVLIRFLARSFRIDEGKEDTGIYLGMGWRLARESRCPTCGHGTHCPCLNSSTKPPKLFLMKKKPGNNGQCKYCGQGYDSHFILAICGDEVDAKSRWEHKPREALLELADNMVDGWLNEAILVLHKHRSIAPICEEIAFLAGKK